MISLFIVDMASRKYNLSYCILFLNIRMKIGDVSHMTELGTRQLKVRFLFLAPDDEVKILKKS